MDATTPDGPELDAQGVAAVEIHRGRVVHFRDYFVDPILLELIWGTRTEEREPALVDHRNHSTGIDLTSAAPAHGP